uniref:Uncharacterized protein TCIL3000_11_15600 n=1 Tax=Trypanosoma congolense (strain IL3000) TaxID=1068625 RepID=G0V327_TRYCI|nr:unnamed protein product [Trypanosoma congolense IL3000]
MVQSEPHKKRSNIAVNGHFYLLHAALAGTFGALSAVVGKLAISQDGDNRNVTSVTTLAAPLFALLGMDIVNSWWTTAVHIVLRGMSLGVNAFCTAQMWRWYIKALSCGPTPVCQVVNIAANFGVSALLGLLVFHEVVTFTWLIGAVLAAIGLTLVASEIDPAGM